MYQFAEIMLVILHIYKRKTDNCVALLFDNFDVLDVIETDRAIVPADRAIVPADRAIVLHYK
jgi:hypothetical protein